MGEIQESQLPTHVQAVAPVSTGDDPVRQMLDHMGRLEAKPEEVMIFVRATEITPSDSACDKAGNK